MIAFPPIEIGPCDAPKPSLYQAAQVNVLMEPNNHRNNDIKHRENPTSPRLPNRAIQKPAGTCVKKYPRKKKPDNAPADEFVMPNSSISAGIATPMLIRFPKTAVYMMKTINSTNLR